MYYLNHKGYGKIKIFKEDCGVGIVERGIYTPRRLVVDEVAYRNIDMFSFSDLQAFRENGTWDICTTECLK